MDRYRWYFREFVVASKACVTLLQCINLHVTYVLNCHTNYQLRLNQTKRKFIIICGSIKCMLGTLVYARNCNMFKQYKINLKIPKG